MLGPNHSPVDRSLSIRIDPAAPGGFVVHSFAGDDPLNSKDYVRERAGMERWEPTRQARGDNIARMADRVRKPVKASNKDIQAADELARQVFGHGFLVVREPIGDRFRKRAPSRIRGWRAQ
jgi:hypothetical protein